NVEAATEKIIPTVGLVGMICCSAMLYFIAGRLNDAAHSTAFLLVVYGAMFFLGICNAFFLPTASALRALLVPRHAYESAATWGSAAWQTGTIVGPGISGFIYAWVGFENTILVVLGMLTVVLLLLSQIKDRKVENPASGSVVEKIKEGIRFVRQTKMLLYSISLDLFSVLFGGVVAILPVFAIDILEVGEKGLGILRAAPSVGAVLTLLLLSRLSVMGQAWRNLLLGVAGFGVATLVFALSKNFWLSVVALFFVGAFDAISVVIRQTILQMLVPDEMRGRVGAVNGIFVSASNELGAFESGLAASLLGTVPSVVFGAAATLGIVGWVWLRTRDLTTESLRQ
ncbi:MAG: MFS transporter, partial [Bacteroidota bacterium]